MDSTQQQKLQNRAARAITNRRFDDPSRPLIQELGWKITEEQISEEVFKSLLELPPDTYVAFTPLSLSLLPTTSVTQQ